MKWTNVLFMALFWSLLPFVPRCYGQSLNYKAYSQLDSLWAQNDADGLFNMGKELAASPSNLDHALSHLARAAGAFRSGDHALALSTLNTLVRLPGKDGGLLVSFAQRIRALTMARLGDPNSSIVYADSGLVHARKWDLTQDEAILLVVRSEAFIQKDDLDKALLDLTQADRICWNNGHLRASALTKNALGLLYYKQNRYPEARSQFLEALSLARSQGAKKLEQSTLSNLGSVAIMSGELQQGLLLCDSLLSIADENDTDLRARVLGLKGVIQTRIGDPDAALGTLAQAMNLKDRLRDKAGKVKIQQHMATALWESGQPHRSQDILHNALDGAIQLGDGDLRAQIHWALQDNYHTLNKLDLAYENLLWYVGLSDSLSAAQFDANVAIHETRLGAQQQEHRLAEQKQALALAENEVRRRSIQRNALTGATLALVVIALLLYRSIRNRKRLAEKEKELHDEQVDQLLSQQEMKSINAMLEGQEQERARVSKELHDHVGHLLGTIKHQLGQLEEQVADVRSEQTAQYRKVTGLLDNAAGALRRISHDMAAATLSRFGLDKALRDLRDTIHINGRLQVELNTYGLEHPLERGVEIAVYRIIQEAVSNVLKHAQANEMSIAVTHAPGRMSVLVSDNGQGFDTSKTSHGVGLANIRSRAAALGAQVQIDSAPGKGTTISVECPVME